MDRVALFSATTYTLFGLATALTVGRVISRWRGLKGARYGFDDWTSFVTYACIVGLTVANYYQLSNGLGQQRYGLDEGMVKRFLLWVYVSQHFYIAAIFGTKLSLVLLYLRVWPERKAFRRICILLVLALICAFVAFEVVAIIQCLPITSNWTSSTGRAASCIDREAYVYGLASIDIAFNVALLLLPIPYMVRIDTHLLRKISVLVAIVVGLVVIAISAVRLNYLSGIPTESNVTWYYSYIGLYSSIEVYLSQICCCIPAIIGVPNRAMHGSSRLSGRSRTSASTSRSQVRGSGAVVGIKGIGPSEPEDPEKARSGDDASFEDYERAPSPTIGLSSHRSWEETIASRSQFPLHHRPLSSTQFQQPASDMLELETLSNTSIEDLQTVDEEDETTPDADTSRVIGVPSIVLQNQQILGQRPQSVRLSTDLVPFEKEIKPSASRLNLQSW